MVFSFRVEAIDYRKVGVPRRAFRRLASAEFYPARGTAFIVGGKPSIKQDHPALRRTQSM
jgi:hypothetical protein